MVLCHSRETKSHDKVKPSIYSLECGPHSSFRLIIPHCIRLWRKCQQLGVCTADGSSELTGTEHVQRFFADPSAHCVGYGDRLTKKPIDTTAATTPAAAVATAMNRDPKDDNNIDRVVAHPDTVVGAAATAAALEPSQPEVVDGVEPPTSGETELGSSACPALLVRNTHARIEKLHQNEGLGCKNGFYFRGDGCSDQVQAFQNSHSLTEISLNPHPHLTCRCRSWTSGTLRTVRSTGRVQ